VKFIALDSQQGSGLREDVIALFAAACREREKANNGRKDETEKAHIVPQISDSGLLDSVGTLVLEMD
jgi:hypothetical protein